MQERTYSALVVLVSIAIIAISGYAYSVASDNALKSLHDRYDVVIDAHVLIPPATASTLGQGHSSETFLVNATSLDFGSVSPGTVSAFKGLDITNRANTSVKVVIATDLNTPGVILTTGLSKDLFTATRSIVSADGVKSLQPISISFDEIPVFRIEVAPNTAGMDLTFHIIIYYSNS
jgi:hypothetical protein